MADTAARHMQCMEVWGGNRVVDTAVSLPGLDAWIYSRPFKSDAGGDVHYVSSCATGRITRLLVADVCGHGQAVASIAIQLRTLMRRFVNHIDQTRFVESMNRHFAEMAEAGSFATAVVNTYFAPIVGVQRRTSAASDLPGSIEAVGDSGRADVREYSAGHCRDAVRAVRRSAGGGGLGDVLHGFAD
jgi:hypothetical protein